MTKLRVEKSKYNAESEADLQNQLRAEGYSCFAWQDRPGAYYSPHSHPHDEYIVVYSGEINFEAGGENFCLTAGDALVLPANTTHTAMNERQNVVRYFICTK